MVERTQHRDALAGRHDDTVHTWPRENDVLGRRDLECFRDLESPAPRASERTGLDLARNPDGPSRRLNEPLPLGFKAQANHAALGPLDDVADTRPPRKPRRLSPVGQNMKTRNHGRHGLTAPRVPQRGQDTRPCHGRHLKPGHGRHKRRPAGPR